MEAFVSRKKRKLSSGAALQPSPSPSPSLSQIPREERSLAIEEEESTDFKLALLSSLHPNTDQNDLLDILLAHEGSVLEASSSLAAPHRSPSRKSGPSAGATGYQSSLSSFITQDDSGKPAKLLVKRGKTLHLYDPADVEAHTPCSIIHNFLPPAEANALLEELLLEAPTFERETFKLFDNVVSSPHTNCFYVESHEEMQRQKTEYIYNGAKLTDVRQLTPYMLSASPKVTAAVNASINTRIQGYPNKQKLVHQCPHPWRPNAAVVNCYSGPTESVGYHADQLTYLGPRATIGSLSLGVAREFRVRRIVPQDDSSSSTSKSKKNTEAADLQGQISIHLPHNSLLVMHAEMQEEWKHSIAPCTTVIPHPISGNKRINITYRDYKEYMHPRFTPRCKCGVPAVLRVVQRKKANWGRYFWMCYVGNVPEKGKEGCTFFEWAVFDDDGRPVWKQHMVLDEKVGDGAGELKVVGGGRKDAGE
ncbi:GRF zinc finger protein [Drepanopeziza brunnea f. sp. 'multigermtubi' MB_m1]|uniref:GRF zinc finger protein n=2 Tax=Drepanopeziza brunnea f. sp. 'multigermtubi' TaxID=698441 RepID=K1X3B9_MARBU|nr:GRF zinc finger protein [Drepanopeziza brunnea f. sp. 'multigermtubi' MB_m1]EKD19711.1 GRF zinc finger protein [Drepanopeziza brunnea f. sp. 'multigermtubi' MB_m1]